MKSDRIVGFHRERANALEVLYASAEHIRAISANRSAVAKFIFELAVESDPRIWTGNKWVTFSESFNDSVGACALTGFLAGVRDTMYSAVGETLDNVFDFFLYDCEHCNASFDMFRSGTAFDWMSEETWELWLKRLDWYVSDDYDAI